MGGVYSSLVFLPPNPSYEETDKDLVKVGNIPTYFFTSPSKKPRFTMLYSHGNAEDIGQSKYWMQLLVEKLDVDLIVYDYEGYGLHPGKSSEANCYDNIERIYAYLRQEKHIDAANIILYGRSLGSGPTVHMAQKICSSGGTLGGLILQSPIASAVRVVSRALALIPGVDTFDNFKKVDDIKCPTLIIHGVKDDVVPFWHGQLLAQKFQKRGLLKDFLKVPEGDHNSLEVDHEDEIIFALKTYIDFLEEKKPHLKMED